MKPNGVLHIIQKGSQVLLLKAVGSCFIGARDSSYISSSRSKC
ncbi:MAG TPA: hypothetical protein VF233_12495 [Nitrososphaeraceae archaeon]